MLSDLVVSLAFVTVVAIVALKVSNGDLVPLVRSWGVSPPPASPRQLNPDVDKRGVATAATAGAHGTLDAWVYERTREFGKKCEAIESSQNGITHGQLRSLYDKRGEILGHLYGRKRFMPNDDGILETMDRRIDGIDNFTTGWISKLEKESPEVRGMSGPLSCGDGEARFLNKDRPLPTPVPPFIGMRV